MFFLWHSSSSISGFSSLVNMRTVELRTEQKWQVFSRGNTHIQAGLWPHITILALWAGAGLFYLIWHDIYTLCSFTQCLPFFSFHSCSIFFPSHMFSLSSSKSPFSPTFSSRCSTSHLIFAVIFPQEAEKHNNSSVLLTPSPSSHLPSYYTLLVLPFLPTALLPVSLSLIILAFPSRRCRTNYHQASPASHRA